MIAATKGEKVFQSVLIVIMVLACIAFVYPVLNILAISLSGSQPILRGEISFFPKELTFVGYEGVFSNVSIFRAFGNSIYVAVVGCILSLVMTGIAAYPMAFGDFYGKKFYSVFIVITMWFQAGLIPSFMVIKDLNLLDSHWALILNALCGAYNVIILRSFYNSIPDSVIESARIDGANDIRIFFQIVIPLSKVAFATIALWIIVAHWNDFFAPLMYLRTPTKYTLQIVLRDIIITSNMSNYDLAAGAEGSMALPAQVQNAVVFVSMVPMLIIYPFLQKYFVKGVMLGSVKG
ncbi:MAG: carbohydrate ABC transporter permease [Oscillospiraceae bacterium]